MSDPTAVRNEMLAKLKATRAAVEQKKKHRLQSGLQQSSAIPKTSATMGSNRSEGNMGRGQSTSGGTILAPSSSPPDASSGRASKYYTSSAPVGKSSNLFGDSSIPRVGGGARPGQSTKPSSSGSNSNHLQPPPRKKQAYENPSSPFSSQPASRPSSPGAGSQGSGYGSSAVGASSLGDRMGRTGIDDAGEEEEGSSDRDVLGRGGRDAFDARIKHSMVKQNDGNDGGIDDEDETMGSDDVAATPDGKAVLARFARRAGVPELSPGAFPNNPTASPNPSTPSDSNLHSPSQSSTPEGRSPEHDHSFAIRMAHLYQGSMTEERVHEIMAEYSTDKYSTVAKRISAAVKGQDYRLVQPSHPPSSSPAAGLPPISRLSNIQTPEQYRQALSGNRSNATNSPPSTAFSRVAPQGKYVPPTIVKKVKESAIYAGRTGTGERMNNVASTSALASGSNGNGHANFPIRGKKRKTGGQGSGSDDGDGPGYREEGRSRRNGGIVENIDEEQVLGVFNTCTPELLTGSIVCTLEQAESIISLRPYASVEDLKKKLARKKGVSFSLFEQYQNVMQGYIEVDRCLAECEVIGTAISEIMNVWTGASAEVDANGEKVEPDAVNNDTGLHISSVNKTELMAAIGKERDPRKREKLGRYHFKQPKHLSEGVVLKDYQMVGLNWLSLLHRESYSCILADEMGLGKTIQVIAFFCLLKEQGRPGPHLVVVPSSTLENWVREFQKFAKGIKVQTYYGSQAERYSLRKELQQDVEDGQLEVLITTYDMAWKADDHKFLRKKMSFDCAVFDEGHTLKNFESQRYQSLIAIKPRWRLLLTGTPLQNNLQELVSLLNFILPDIFNDAEDSLRQIFKVHAKGTANLLSQQRVSRARTMMTPFVLRRRKAQVLKDLPARTDRVLPCVMTASQRFLYDRSLRRSRAVLDEVLKDEGSDVATPEPKKGRKGVLKVKDDGSANILMDLRKATNHPLMFRRVYTDAKIRVMARDCMNEVEFVDSNYDMIVEDMAVMSDAELYQFCLRYKSVKKHTIPIKHFLNVGKVQAMKKLLESCIASDRRMLLFSQFTQVLDILQVVLNHLGYRYIRLDGSTKVDERQNLVDDFTEDEGIKVFLLSTRAGGMGINLVAASVVCIYDQDFNPHNDRQAADRAYRIGQTREVEVIKLLSENTIDEDIYRLGITKLKLDDAVGGGSSGAAGDSMMETSGPGGAGGGASGGMDDTPTANEIKKSLLTTVKAKAEEIVALQKDEEEDDVDVDAEDGGDDDGMDGRDKVE